MTGKKKGSSMKLALSTDLTTVNAKMISLQDSPFTSSIITVQVGQSPKLFKVHSNVLSQSAVFRSMMESYTDDKPIVIADMKAPMFDLVVRFLYGSRIDSWKHILTTEPESQAQEADLFRSACEIFCFALKYDLPKLKTITASHICGTENISYQSVLTAARHVYTNAPTIEPWFQDFVWNKTREALAINPDLASETWFVDTFEHGYAGLSKQIFECYRSCYGLFNRNIDTPVSRTGSIHVAALPVDTKDGITRLQSHQAVLYSETHEDQGARLERQEWVDLKDEGSNLYGETKRLEDSIQDEAMVAEDIVAQDLVREDIVEEVPIEEAPDDETSSTRCEPASEEPVRSNLCAKRKHHLRRMSRWQNCSICTQEVVEIARNASRG